MRDGTRPATLMDHPAVVRVERRAGEMFLGTPMQEIAADEAVSLEQFRTFVDDDAAWIHRQGGTVVGYLLAERLDEAGHVEQVSVDPAFAGRRIGADLLDAAANWAAGQGLAILTLTTFSELPWNAPYYARLGFEVLPQDRWGPELATRVQEEVSHGLHRWARVAMGRPT
ncbi:GNAT family N-acetyltransferase [Nesterenkonia sp. HG001]|uniref:GNAT family N-acetyltransferase n=1 Tax=Nesterenkonia sp. HG001 TaxID=2983207 RepID=UPI002AC3EE83|nr:GNAT family N-acetyltransferase [Nesterenkonia sp. HG001]MDZ5078261.1 GNAT family N-acetyltransferase [Nesterenkonia sp. HG001]